MKREEIRIGVGLKLMFDVIISEDMHDLLSFFLSQ